MCTRNNKLNKFNFNDVRLNRWSQNLALVQQVDAHREEDAQQSFKSHLVFEDVNSLTL